MNGPASVFLGTGSIKELGQTCTGERIRGAVLLNAYKLKTVQSWTLFVLKIPDYLKHYNDDNWMKDPSVVGSIGKHLGPMLCTKSGDRY